jgi:HNH endonuclease/AP2 domain
MTTLTQARLKQLLHYEPATGVFTWLVDRLTRGRVNVVVGQRAGTSDRAGYRSVMIDSRRYQCSHIAVLWMTGSWPDHEVDHKDCDPSNDAWGNLRQATSSENKWNRRVSKNSRSGLKGAYWDNSLGCWRSQIMRHGKSRHLGRFNTAEEAHEAYVAAAKDIHGEFARR